MQVSGDATFSKNVSVAGTLTGATIKATGGMETKTFKATGAATFGSTVGVTGKITGGGGLQITNGANIAGTLTVDKLIVTGDVEIQGNSVCNNNMKSKTITTTSTITADSDIRTKKAFHSTEEYIEFHWEGSPLHKLYVHGGSRALGGGDAFIQTVN